MAKHKQLDVFHVQATPATNECTQQRAKREIEKGEGHALDRPTKPPPAATPDFGALQWTIPASIWHDFMSAALASVPVQNFVTPTLFPSSTYTTSSQ
jgi:hypothetical protein